MNTDHETFVQKLHELKLAIRGAAFLTDVRRKFLLTIMIDEPDNVIEKVMYLYRTFVDAQLANAPEYLEKVGKEASFETLQRLHDALQARERIIKAWYDIRDAEDRSNVENALDAIRRQL